MDIFCKKHVMTVDGFKTNWFRMTFGFYILIIASILSSGLSLFTIISVIASGISFIGGSPTVMFIMIFGGTTAIFICTIVFAAKKYIYHKTFNEILNNGKKHIRIDAQLMYKGEVSRVNNNSLGSGNRNGRGPSYLHFKEWGKHSTSLYDSIAFYQVCCDIENKKLTSPPLRLNVTNLKKIML